MNKINQKKYHFIYKTTNLLSGRYYIGMHSTNNLDDDYLGSGDQLRKAIRKHGKENFKREILEFCSSREELHNKESELVTLNEVRDKECMNMKVGGIGIWPKSANDAFKAKMKSDPEFRQSFVDRANHLNESGKARTWTGQEFKGKKHSEESLKQMRESHANRNNTAEHNSQHGTMWITNEKENIKINKDSPIPEGYRKGRKMKLLYINII